MGMVEVNCFIYIFFIVTNLLIIYQLHVEKYHVKSHQSIPPPPHQGDIPSANYSDAWIGMSRERGELCFL